MTTKTATGSIPSDGLIAHQQAVLDAIKHNTSGKITAAFSDAIAAVMPSAAKFRSAYQKELQHSQAVLEDQGGAPEDARVTLYWLHTSGFLDALLRSLQDNLEKTAKQVAPAITTGYQQAQAAGKISGVAMVAQTAKVPVSKVQLAPPQPARPTPRQLLQQAMALDDASEPPEGVDETIDAMPQQTSQKARQSLITGALSGMNGQIMMMGVQTVLQGALTSMMGLGENVAADAMQQSALVTIASNPALVDGWIWAAEGGACIACLEMDGSFHTWDEPFDSHPNCGCTAVSYAGPASGLDEYAGRGEDWFNEQDDAVQAEILGPSKYLAWKNGDIQLFDLVSREGGYLHERSLKELGLDFRDYLQQLPTKRELLELPDISLLGPHTGLVGPTASLDAAERYLSGLRTEVEQAFVFSSRGDFIFTKQGIEAHAEFTDKEVARMRGNILTHNHLPGEKNIPSFSPNDVRALRDADLAEIRAVSGDVVYSLKPPIDGWGNLTSDDLVAKLHDAELTAAKDLHPDVAAGRISLSDAQKEVRESALQHLADETGMRYSRTMVEHEAGAALTAEEEQLLADAERAVMAYAPEFPEVPEVKVPVIAPKDYPIKGVQFEMGSEEKAELKSIFGRTISKNEVASWLQAAPDEVVQVEVIDDGVVNIQVMGEGHEATFEISRDESGQIIASGDVAVESEFQGVGTGRQILQGMQAMSTSGIDKIEMEAARGPNLNGYITWARLHGTGDIPASILKAAQAEFGDVTRVEQIMDMPGGSAWWREHGTTWEATFDLHAGSDTMKMVDRLLGIEAKEATTAEVSPEVRALQDQRATLQAQRDAIQAKQDVLSARWAKIVRETDFTEEDEAAAAEKKLAAIEKQQANNIKRMDALDQKISALDKQIAEEAAPGPLGTLEEIKAGEAQIERLYGDLPIGDPQTMEQAAFGNNPYARIGGIAATGADPEMVAAVERAAQIQEETISNLATRLADNRTFMRFARYMGYDQDRVGAYLVSVDNAKRAEALGRRVLSEEDAKLAAMTREEAQVWAKHEAMQATVYDIFDAFHSIPAGGDELFVQTPLQIAMQDAVKAEFKLKTAAGYWSDEAIAAAQAEWGTYRNGMRAFFRGMYDETQAYFQEHGITDVQLFRGMRWTEDKAPTDIAFDGRVVQSAVNGAPMTSWASNAEVALDYARDIGGTARPATEAADVGMLLATKVPVSQILSTPFTGFGTSVLREMILLGKPEDALALPFAMRDAPTLDSFLQSLAGKEVRTGETVAEAAAAAGDMGLPALTYTLPEIDQKAEAAIIQQAQDVLSGGGVASHEDILALGQPIHDYLDARIGPLADWAADANTIYTTQGKDLSGDLIAWLAGDTSQHGGFTVQESLEQYQAAMRQETIRLVDQVRGVGSTELDVADGAPAALEDMLHQVEEAIPTDWLDASNDGGEVTLLNETTRRGYYRSDSQSEAGTIGLRNNADTTPGQLYTAMVHELGHRMEDSVEGLWEAEQAFYEARTAGEAWTNLPAALKVMGRTKTDDFADPYLGKDPIRVVRGGGLPDTYHYELFSSGLEWVLGTDYRGAWLLSRDEEFHQFILGLLFGATGGAA